MQQSVCTTFCYTAEDAFEHPYDITSPLLFEFLLDRRDGVHDLALSGVDLHAPLQTQAQRRTSNSEQLLQQLGSVACSHLLTFAHCMAVFT